MQKILQFLYRHLALWIFILLELGSVALLLNQNLFQQSVAFQTGTTVSAWCYTISSSISQYFGLRSENRLLAEQNAELMNENERLKQQSTLFNQQNSDTINNRIITTKQEIHYINARVIHNTLYRTQNRIIVNKGMKQGVAVDMGVFTSSGVVGVVERVSDNYAVILPLINPNQRVSAKLQASDQLGSITWKGYDPYHIQMSEVPAHARPQDGDTIVTSGYSAIFPEGKTIGVIESATLSENARFWAISIKPAVDFGRLKYVTISAYTHLDEYKQIEATL